jgi:hypothetical protein
MAWVKTVTLPPELEAELDKVRKAAPPPPQKYDPIYKYLKRVYRLRHKVESSPELQKAIQDYHQAHYKKTSRNYAGVIIQMTGPDHVVTSKKKHKYVTALECAFRAKVEPEKLVKFIQDQGGLNAVGELYKKKYRRKAAQS